MHTLNNIADAIAPPETPFNPIPYWYIVRRRLWEVLGLALLITLLVTVVVYMMTPVYRSSVSLLVEPNKPKFASMDTAYGGGDQTSYPTQVDMLRSRVLMEAVVDRLKLSSHPLFTPSEKNGVLSLLGTHVVGSDTASRRRAASMLASMVNIEPSRTSQLIRISVDSTDKEMAATIANSIAEVYIDLDMEAHYKMTQKATSWMNSRLLTLKDNLYKSEHALQDYREQHNIINSASLEMGGAANQLGANLGNLTAARLTRSQAQANLEQVRKAKGNEVSLPIVQRNPLVANLMVAVSDRERNASELANRYGKDHPKMMEAQAQLKQAKENLRLQVADVVSGLEREYEVARASENILAGAVAEVKQTIQGSNRKEFELTSLEREVKTNRELYDLFMGQLKETSAVSDMQTVVARVVDPAIVSDAPVRPNKMLLIGSSFVLSLLLGVVIAVMLDRLDSSVRSVEDAESKIGLPILAALPRVDLTGGQLAALISRDAPKSQFAEGIKTARTGILLSGIDHAHKTLVVTSSLPGEGKSTIAVNLAMAHAQTRRVLLIDADMRKPSIAGVLGLDNTHPGLSMLVLGRQKIEDCVYRIEGSSLEVLTAGSIPPNPLELLMSERFRNLLGELGKVYDTIVIDAPPVQMVSDAVVLGSMATGIVFVIKADSTPFQLARRAILALQRGNGSLFGIVLNQASFRNDSYYGAYGKHQAYYGAAG